MCKEIDITRFDMDQLTELAFAEGNGIDISIYADPKYSADRMEAITDYLTEGLCEEGLQLMLDKAVSDREAWNLLIKMKNGMTLEELLMESDEKEY